MINVLVTACGCPGGPSVVRALKEEFRVVATDYNPAASGRHFADAFFQVPKGDDPEFITVLLTLCLREVIDAVLPESSHEVLALAKARDQFEMRGIKVLVSNPKALEVSLDKVETYKALDGVVPLPRWSMAFSSLGLKGIARELGYPEVPVVVKPAIGKGARGFRLVKAKVDRSMIDMDQWPNSHTVTLDEVRGPWPVMVMEHLKQDPNEPDAVDLYDTEFGVTKCRRDCRMGVHYEHEAKWDQQLWDMSVKVVETLGLEHFVNVQWMGGKLLEVNPRISTNFYPEGSNYVVAGVRAAVGWDYSWKRPLDGTITRYVVDNHTRGY